MIERYHLDLAAVSLCVGVAVALVDAHSAAARNRSLAAAGVFAAVLGSMQAWRGPLWVVVALVPLAFRDDDTRPHPLGPWTAVLGVAALVGIWAAVPDTEPPLAAAAVLAPLAVAWLVARRAAGPSGSAALVVAVAGAVWAGSAGWGSAMAALGAVGLLATAPLVFGFGHRLAPRAMAVMVVLQAAVGLGLPRLVMSRSVPVAVAVAVVVNLVLVAVAVLVRNRHPGRARRGATSTAVR